MKQMVAWGKDMISLEVVVSTGESFRPRGNRVNEQSNAELDAELGNCRMNVLAWEGLGSPRLRRPQIPQPHI